MKTKSQKSSQNVDIQYFEKDRERPFTPVCSNFKISGEWVLNFKILHSIKGENNWKTVDIGNSWMPASLISEQPTKLRQHPHICIAIAMTLDAHLLRQRWCKTTAEVAAELALNYVKFSEYCWLNNIHKFSDWPFALWDKLLEKYSAGGWSLALDISERAHKAISGMSKQDLDKISRWNDKSINIKRTEVARLLGTSVSQIETRPIRTEIMSRYHVLGYHLDQELPPVREGMSYKRVLMLCTELIKLADLPTPYGLQNIPAFSANNFAKKNGKPPNRTKNISPDSLATLLTEGFKWIETYGPAILKMNVSLVESAHCMKQEGLSHREKCTIALKSIAEREVVESLLNVKVTSLQSDRFDAETSVVSLSKMLQTACFFVIAIMNGRRRDEVAGKVVGLKTQSLEVIDKTLSLYECLFYIEKTDMQYIPFYVNEITYKAFKILEKLSKNAWFNSHGSPPREEHSLFICLNFIGASPKPAWYRASTTGKGDARHFLKRSYSTSEAPDINPHMFRRAYAIVFHYRYENALLQALAQQLRHRDLNQTLHYVFDPGTRSLNDRAEFLWKIPKEEISRARNSHANELQEAVNEVGREKIESVVLEILSGTARSSGGFMRLIQKFHSRLSNMLDYRDSDLRNQSARLSKLLLDRGHSTIPFGHGDCNAGIARPAARCYSRNTKLLQQENASPHICHNCPYHRCTSVHLDGLEHEHKLMKREIAELQADSIKYRLYLTNLQNLEAIIHLHRDRLRSSN